jgi:predicted secreted protein
MKLKFLLSAGLLITALSFQACKCCKKTTDSSTSTSSAAVNITEADANKIISVKVNGKFSATFNECVGCADVWKVKASDDSKINKLADTFGNRSCTNCTGGTQDHIFHFEAKATGTSTLTFTYFDKTISVTIDAK